MSIGFYRKLSWAFGLMAMGMLLGLIGFASTLEIRDLDLWLHIRSGQYIFTHGFVPTVDVFSATAAGLPWNNHEWLFQVVVYLVKTLWGMDGLIYMQTAVVMLTFLLVILLINRREKQLLVIPLLFLVFLVYQTRFTIRPDIFSIFFLATFIYILSMRLSAKWSVWVLFAVQVLWVNMHGYFFWGILLPLIGVLAETIKRRLPASWGMAQCGRLSDEEFSRIQWAFWVVLAASCINPQTFQGAVYPFRILFELSGDSRIFFQNITELQRPITAANFWAADSNWPFKLLIMVSFISFAFNRRRIDLSGLLLWAFMLAFSLLAVRNMVYFAFVAALVTVNNSLDLPASRIIPLHFKDDRFMHITGVMAKILLIVFILNYGGDMATRGYYDFDRYERKSEFMGIDQRGFSHKAVRFILREGIRGNFFNDFNSGAFLIGNAYPAVRVYMDGRTELRGPAFFKKYREIWEKGDGKAFDEEVRKYALTGVFVTTCLSKASPLFLKMLAAKPEWKVVYLDYDAVIFLKDVPSNAQAISRLSIDFTRWEPLAIDMDRLGATPVFPHRAMSRAMTLHSMGLDDQAILECKRALEILPTSVGAYRLQGEIWLERKEYARAFRFLRTGLSLATGDNVLRAMLADAYLGMGKTAYALKEGRKVMERSPQLPQGYFAVAKALSKKQQFEKVYDILLEAVKHKPKDAEDIFWIAEQAAASGESIWEEKFLRLAVDSFKGSAPAHEKLGDLYAREGRTEESIREWKRALEIDPQNSNLNKKAGTPPQLPGENTK
jgi:tetratricopeptide (TPR) repeat protein